MEAISIKLNSVDAAIKAIDKKVANYEKEIQVALNVWAQETATIAKQYAPVDEGHLRGSINAEPGDMRASVTVAVNYAAYLEFGTRKFAAEYVGSLPDDWQTFASQFKGGGDGGFKDFVKRIMEWCRRKGIDEAAAYPIARKIIINGIKARPFLFPATQQTKKTLIEDIKAIISK